MIIQISFLNEINEGLSVPRKTNLCTESAEWFGLNIYKILLLSNFNLLNKIQKHQIVLGNYAPIICNSENSLSTIK